jgi:hypothetical protein
LCPDNMVNDEEGGALEQKLFTLDGIYEQSWLGDEESDDLHRMFFCVEEEQPMKSERNDI